MILDLIGRLIAVVPVVGVVLLTMTANTKRVIRVRQYPMPVVAGVYGIAALIALHSLNSWVDDVLRGVFRVIPFLRGWYDTTWQLVIENTVVVLVFLVVKLILRRLFDRWFQGENFPGSSLVVGVYRYDAEEGAWFVRAGMGMLRMYLRMFFIVSVAIAAVLVALASGFPAWPGFIAVSFPAVAALVVGECFFAVDGLTRREFTGDIRGEDDRSDRVVDYSGLRDVLKATFPGRVIDDAVSFASADAMHTHARLEALARSGDEADRLAAGYFERLKLSGWALDANLVDASADLMRDRSTLIVNPFYADLTPYLVFPAYYHLLQYRKCLVIAGRDSIASDLVRWMDKGLEDITGVPGLWRVGLLDRTERSDLDVGVLRYADLHDRDVLLANDDFLHEVRYVIFAEPSRALAAGQVGLGLVLSRCGGEGTPVFAAFDRNHDGLVDTLSHLLKIDLTDVVATAVPHGVSSELIWRAEGEPLHATVLPSVTRSLGAGTAIGAVAAKYDVSSVEWVGADAYPVQDMAWISGQYYGQINAFADLDVSQNALSEVIRPHRNPWDLETAANLFVIVEDEIHNVYESVRLYATRAQEQGFVNLISEDYLLRDYMIANRAVFAADAKAVPSIVPDYARTERNLALRLMLTLMTFGMTEGAIARELEFLGFDLPPVIPPQRADPDEDVHIPPAISQLQELIGTHTGVTPTLRKELIHDFHGAEERWERRYLVESATPLDAVANRLRAAYFFVEDEAEERDYIGAALYGLVYQIMLPGQFVTYAGKYYEVRSIGDDVGRSGVVLRRAAEHLRERRVYRQQRSFRLSRVELASAAGAEVAIGDVVVRSLFADIEVDTHGYLDLPARSDLVGGREVLVSGIPRRSYVHKSVLELRLPEVTPGVRRTIAVLLNELFVTIFPDAHHYVVVLTADERGSLGPLLDDVIVEDSDPDSLYIVEDSPIDMGLLVAVDRNWRRLLEIVADYLEWQTTPSDDPEGARTAFVVAFPGETEEALDERRRVAAEQDASAARTARAPRRRRWWWWWERLTEWWRRRTATRPHAVDLGQVASPPPADASAPALPPPLVVDAPPPEIVVELTAEAAGDVAADHATTRSSRTPKGAVDDEL